MKIVLFGASGMIGQRILQEALTRGHEVTAVVRNPAGVTQTHPHLTVVAGDATQADVVAQVAAGHEAVISAIGPGMGDLAMVSASIQAYLAGLPAAGVKRFLVVGGAGSLEVAPGVQLVDTPQFPEAWRPVALAHRDVLYTLRSVTNLDWTYISPAIFIEPGVRTGSYRLGTEQVVMDADGQSKISCEDYAVALVDVLEKNQFIQQRITVAY